MLGSIIGDMVCSVYEFDNIKKVDFPFFSERSTYTDDSIMTVAVAEWLLSDNTHSHEELEKVMVKYAQEYPFPMGGYGGGFAQWLFHPERLVDYRTGEIAGRRVPYNSWGNGAAMRASAVGWKFRTLEETEKVAEQRQPQSDTSVQSGGRASECRARAMPSRPCTGEWMQ